MGGNVSCMKRAPNLSASSSSSPRKESNRTEVTQVVSSIRSNSSHDKEEEEEETQYDSTCSGVMSGAMSEVTSVDNHDDFINHFIRSSWPGSVLNWSDDEVMRFINCFTLHEVKDGEEISTSDPSSFFIIASGEVEVHAILPTKNKKTGNIREFLCKKDVGDMVYIKYVRELIKEANMRYSIEQADTEDLEKAHKSFLEFSVKSQSDCTLILQIDWDKFDSTFGKSDGTVDGDVISPCDTHQIEGRNDTEHGTSSCGYLDVNMLRVIMRTNLSNYLVKIPLFQDLPQSKLETVSRLCHYSVQKKGSIICQEGETGEDVFILLKGEVKVEAMASKRMVELFEDGILEENSSSCNDHSESDNSKNTSTQGSRKGSDASLRKGSVQFQCDYRSSNKMTRGQRTISRRRQTLIQATHECLRENFREVMDHETQPENEPLNNQRIDELDPNFSVELARLGAGEIFGEISTFIQLPRVATITAVTNVLMVSLSNTSFRTLYHVISPHLESGIEQIVKGNMLQTLLQSKSPFLEEVQPKLVEKMAGLTNITTLDEGTVVFEECDEADNFYFIYSGRIDVSKKLPTSCNSDGAQGESISIGTLYTGDYFGEMAILEENAGRSATVKTLSKTVLLGITRQHFHECFNEAPQLLAELEFRMKGQDSDLDTTLNYSKSYQAFSHYLESIEKVEILKCYEAVISLLERQDRADIDNVIDELYSVLLLITSSLGVQDTLVASLNTSIDRFKQDIDIDETMMLDEIISLFGKVKDELTQKITEDILPSFKQSETFHSLIKYLRVFPSFKV